MKKVTFAGALALAAVTAAAIWWRKNPSACPYGQRLWVQAPHPFITRARLYEALAPLEGENLLEVGPGTGYYTLEAAGWVGPEGTLDIFDIQQEMLDHTMARAADRGIGNIRPTQGDAASLPYEPTTFHGAYLVTVLGEIPDRSAAMAELARVIRPGGRLVVGELMGDPHWVSPKTIAALAEEAGFSVERRLGPPIGSFTVLRKPS